MEPRIPQNRDAGGLGQRGGGEGEGNAEILNGLERRANTINTLMDWTWVVRKKAKVKADSKAFYHHKGKNRISEMEWREWILQKELESFCTMN